MQRGESHKSYKRASIKAYLLLQGPSHVIKMYILGRYDWENSILGIIDHFSLSLWWKVCTNIFTTPSSSLHCLRNSLVVTVPVYATPWFHRGRCQEWPFNDGDFLTFVGRHFRKKGNKTSLKLIATSLVEAIYLWDRPLARQQQKHQL